jgi:ferredoxin
VSVRLEIDRDACEANGVCVAFVPEALELGDDDVLRRRLTVLPAELEPRAREAARACPRRALQVIPIEPACPE